MNPQIWQAAAAVLAAFAALIGGLYAVVTVPLLRSMDRIETRLDRIEARLARIEEKLDDHSDRISRLEERTSPLRRS